MTTTKERLTGILNQITNNRAQANSNHQALLLQIQQSEDQLKNFDSMIAAMQVLLRSEDLLAEVDTQEAEGNAVPLTDASGNTAAVPEETVAVAAEANDGSVGEVSDIPPDAAATA